MIGSIYQNTKQSFGRLFQQRIDQTSPIERLVFYFSTAIVVLVSVYPFYIMLKTSLIPSSELYSLPPELVVTDVSLEHYRTILGQGETFPFLTFIKNSIFVGIATATISVALGTTAAYSYSRLAFPGRKLISRGVFMTYMLAGILLVVPLFQILISLNLVNTLPGIVLAHTSRTLPLAMYLLGDYFSSVPQEIEEAAMVDGYSRLEVILRITLPMSIPAMAVAYIYAFLLSWNEFLFASVFLRSRAKYTIPIGIQKINAAFQTVWGDIMAASVITTIPVVVLIVYLEKYIVGGLDYESFREE